MTIDRQTRNLIATLGADFAINKPPLPPMNSLQRAVGRNRLNARVKAEYPANREFIFPDEGRVARLTIVWDQFRKRDHLATVAMRRALMACHVDDADTAHVWGVPRELRQPPLPAEIAANYGYIKAALQLAGSEHVLLVGTQVLSLWSMKAKMNRVVGNAYVWMDYYVYPTFNPLALGHQLDIGMWRRSFDKLKWALSEGTPLNMLDTVCHECEDKAQVFDERAIGWCDKHYKPTRTKREEAEWAKKYNISNQQSML